MKSPLCWPGGKALAAETILANVVDHVAYAEACCGGAALFWAKPKEQSKAEILNDADGELINFYQVLHKRGRSLAREVDGMPYSRALFDSVRDASPRGSVRRAVRFWYLNRVAFGTQRTGATFGVKVMRRAYVLPARILTTLDATIERLRGVSFESLDVVRFVRLYDRPTTLFFVDPPYYGLSQPYACTFGPADHKRLAAALTDVQGRWLLTYNDCPQVRRLYRRQSVQSMTIRYRAGCNSNSRSGGGGRSQELLISNRSLAPNKASGYPLFPEWVSTTRQSAGAPRRRNEIGATLN